MRYIEYSTSAGPGTLIEHGVYKFERFAVPDSLIGEFESDRGRHIAERITPERYQEFISIHGSEGAV